MGHLISIESLPPELQAYARGELVAIEKRDWAETEWLQARWHRKAFFRSVQREQPGLQYQWPDYEALMRGEINEYIRHVLIKQLLRSWQKAIRALPRLRTLYRIELRRVVLRHLRPHRAKRRHLLKEARHQAIRFATLDPRTLGELEMFVTGNVFYGIPTTSNYFN